MTGGLLDLIRAAKRPERTVELCLRGDLVGEFESLERDLQRLTATRDDSFSASSEIPRKAARIQELRAEMRDSTATFHLRAVGSERSAALIAGHPPRKDEDRDAALGYNPVSFYPALVVEACYALERGEERVLLRDEAGEPTEGALSEEDWARLFGALSNQQFDRLVNVAWDLDHGNVEVPFSPLALLISQRAGESSKQPEAGASRQASSQAASSGRPRRSSTTKKAASSGQ